MNQHSQDKFPFAIRLAGFPPEAEQALAAALQAAPAHGPAYFCLSEHSLQEPDLVLAYGPDLKAMASLAAMAATPGELDARPALVVGQPAVPLPYPVAPLPLDHKAFHVQLALLVARRADALARLAGAGLPPPPERRRSQRLDFDLTDPAEYEAMRGPSRRGAVLVVDGGGRFYAHLGELMKPYNIAVLAAANEASALAACEEGRVSVVLMNTSLPGIDPYALCSRLRAQAGARPPAVVLLVSPPFAYDGERGRAAGVEGLLDKPVADATLKSVMKKLMHIA
ncbi:response regulator [Duganella sp. FT92W]|uniref:Response regulator n=1 Tax=Pseudoduganella rivuli TaxID=2666085 RepID=A0A7X2IRS6_9BURK|nr:response regulator [Pseudoduganella rivuli]MRV74602.1 response regulator [Pseudoduganella rivuli]